MLTDIIERQQIETKNTIAFLRYVLAKRAPQSKEVVGGEAMSAMDTLSMSEHFLQGLQRGDFKTRGTSALGSIAETKEHLSYARPGRVSIMDRATTNYQDTYHKRPADLMRHQMKMQLLK